MQQHPERYHAYIGTGQMVNNRLTDSLMDRINAVRGMADVNWFVHPQLQAHDFRTDVPQLDVPVWVVLGEHEARGRDVLAREWFEVLDAPSKELVIVEGAGHRPSFEDPATFAELLRQVVSEVE